MRDDGAGEVRVMRQRSWCGTTHHQTTQIVVLHSQISLPFSNAAFPFGKHRGKCAKGH